MNSYKKVLSLFIGVFMLLIGCASNGGLSTPEETVETLLEAVTTEDQELMDRIFTEEGQEYRDLLSDSDEGVAIFETAIVGEVSTFPSEQPKVGESILEAEKDAAFVEIATSDESYKIVLLLKDEEWKVDGIIVQ